MRIRIKITDLTEPQWRFIERFVGTEYPLDGTAIRVCYEFAPAVEFNTVLPYSKFLEIQEHLARLDKFGHPYLDPDQQDDWERENRPQTVVREAVEADQAKMREMVEIIGRMCETVDGMRADLRAWKNEPVSTYPKEMLR
jgi:hypothetical protein